MKIKMVHTPIQNLKQLRILIIQTLILVLFSISLVNAQQPYEWKSVIVGGGGFVPGLQFNETEKNLLYARTDIGGSYRWDEETKTWIAITDAMDNGNDMGNMSIATDPVEPNRLYIATGLYYQSWWGEMGAVFRSEDKGKTWQSSRLTFKMGGNTPGRGAGERLRIDPNSNNILYLGSPKNGLWRSDDYAKTWKKVEGLPHKSISFVEYYKGSGKKGEPTPVIFVGVYDHVPQKEFKPSVYKSTDAGKTWEPLSGQPLKLDPKPLDSSQTKANFPMTCTANRIAISGDVLYIAYANSIAADGDYEWGFPAIHIHNGAVYKYTIKTGEWKNITPAPKQMGGYAGVTVSPEYPNLVAVVTTCSWWPGDEIFISNNQGESWKKVLYKNEYSNDYKALFDHSKAPYAQNHRPHWTSDIKIDPFNPNRAIFGTGYGVYMCYNLLDALDDKPTTWVFENYGLEETAALEIVSPPSGPSLVTALGDIDGFAHYNLSVSPPAGEHHPHRGTCRSIDVAWKKPEIMVRANDKGEVSQAMYSLDSGKTWKEFESQPAKRMLLAGNIAISSDGKIIVWAPEKIGVFTSFDFGKSWTKCGGGIPVNAHPVADKEIPYQFYAKENTSGTIFVSTDSAKTFKYFSGAVGKGEEGNIESVFGKKGHIWAACGKGGLWYSTNEGNKFKQVLNVQSCGFVTFGKEAPGGKYPAVFIFGEVGDIKGIFRSDNMGKNWVRINDKNTLFGNNRAPVMSGDPRIYGRVYVSGTGRGVLYGDIVK
jgi:photosystem II stability/assembly factor-like uncharacterized protein